MTWGHLRLKLRNGTGEALHLDTGEYTPGRFRVHYQPGRVLTARRWVDQSPADRARIFRRQAPTAWSGTDRVVCDLLHAAAAGRDLGPVRVALLDRLPEAGFDPLAGTYWRIRRRHWHRLEWCLGPRCDREDRWRLGRVAGYGRVRAPSGDGFEVP